LENTPLLRGGGYQPMSFFRGKYMRSGREKEGTFGRKRNQGERKRKKWEVKGF
jgi:hypothetical protein